jgi:hypothetical protein
MSRRTVLAFSVLAVYLLVSVSLLRLPAAVVDPLIDEDGLIEWFGALCLLLGSCLIALSVRELRRTGASWVKQTSYVVVGLILFVAFGEEISWGQRIFDIATPEALLRVNSQGETNFHNLYGNENGQNFSNRAFQLFWASLGILLPVLALWKPAGRVLRRYVPVLPLWFAVLFIGQQLLWKPVQALWRQDPGAWGGTHRGRIGHDAFRVENVSEVAGSGATGPAGLAEVMEANIEVLLAAAALWLLLSARSARITRTPASIDPSVDDNTRPLETGAQGRRRPLDP